MLSSLSMARSCTASADGITASDLNLAPVCVTTCVPSKEWWLHVSQMPASSPGPWPRMSEYEIMMILLYVYIIIYILYIIYIHIYILYIYISYPYILILLLSNKHWSFHLHQPSSEHFRTLRLAGTFLTVCLLSCAWLGWNRAWAPLPKFPPNKCRMKTVE